MQAVGRIHYLTHTCPRRAAHNEFITRGTNRTAGGSIGELLKGKLAFYIT